jgi:arylsulfatase A-like enzyme
MVVVVKEKNVVIILVDAFRPKNTSVFGYEKETDKFIKKISKESFLFKDFFSSSNCTAPSLTTIFTGRFPNTHGIIHQFPYTSQEEINKFQDSNSFWLPTFLQEKGYETIAVDWIGMWFKKGFNYYKDKKDEKPNPFLNHPFIRRILLNLPSWAYAFGKKMIKARASPKFPTAEQTMDTAIERVGEAIDTKKPFFLFTHFWDTHFPFPNTKNPKPCGKKDLSETLKGITDEKHKEYFKKRIVDIGLDSVDDMVAKYDLAIKNVDVQVGKLYKFLKKKDVWDDTIFVLLGDHGTNLADNGIYFSSSSLFDDTLHVPFVMHLPGLEGKKVKGFAQNTDIVPTILDFLGYGDDGKVSDKIEGLSMLPLVEQEKQIRDKIIAWDGLSHEIKCVRTKNKKLILAKDPECNLCKSAHHGKEEEYDLVNDPEERRNIYSGDSELKKYLK